MQRLVLRGHALQPNTVYLFNTLYTKCAMSLTPIQFHLGTKKRLSFKKLSRYIVIFISGSSLISSVWTSS